MLKIIVSIMIITMALPFSASAGQKEVSADTLCYKVSAWQERNQEGSDNYIYNTENDREKLHECAVDRDTLNLLSNDNVVIEANCVLHSYPDKDAECLGSPVWRVYLLETKIIVLDKKH